MPPKQEKGGEEASGWSEPPLATPRPSFMDHRGLERVGVLEHMMPLGTMPTAKVKARAKQDPLRRTAVQAQNLSAGMIVDDARSTPDLNMGMNMDLDMSMIDASNNGTDTPIMGDEANMFGDSFAPAMQEMQIPQLPPEFQGYQAAMMQNMQYPMMQEPMEPAQTHMQMPLQAPMAPQMHVPMQTSPQPPVQLPMQAMQTTFSVSESPALSTPQAFPQRTPGPRPGSKHRTPTSASPVNPSSLRKALDLAQQNGFPQLDLQLAHLQQAAANDPEFATLLSFAVTNNSLDEKGSAIRRKLKQLKAAIRSQHASPVTQLAAGSTVGMEPSQSIAQQQTPVLQNFHAYLASPQPQSSPSGMKRKPKSATTSNGTTGTQIDPSLNQGGDRPAVSRASSSDLSSVDEQLAAGPPPTLSTNIKPDPATRDAEDTELDAQKKRLRKSFDDVQVNDSDVRQPLPHKPLSSSRRNTKPKLPKSARSSTADTNTAPPSDTPAVDASSQATTPPPPTALGRPPKRLKTAAKIKISPVKNRQPAVFAGISRPDGRRQTSVDIDTKSQVSDNNDYCSACGGTGFLLCCDGCDRSFHFTCLDPPLDQSAVLDEPWFCYICQSRSLGDSKLSHGLFSELLRRIASKNPSSFKLPAYVRDYFEGVRTGENGEYVDAQTQKASTTKYRLGYDDPPDYKKLRDSKGNAILCYQCGESALENRDVVPCDYCNANWHLNCLNPPLASVPNRGAVLTGKSRPLWMCPLHTDHDLRQLDPIQGDGVRLDGIARTHRVRRPKNARILDTALRRGFANNGMIEVDDDTSDEDALTDEEGPEGIVFRVPARGIKLDFIDKAKSNRSLRTALAKERTANIDLHTARLEYVNQSALANDIAKRRLDERKTILNLTQFSSGTHDIGLGMTEMEKLLYALEAEAPEEVVQKMREDPAYPAPAFKLDWAGNVVSASQDAVAQQLSRRERDVLLRLQQHIGRVLDYRPEGEQVVHAQANGVPNGYAPASSANAAATAAAGLAMANGFV